MPSANHSLFALTNKLAAGRAFFLIKIATREMWNLALAREPFFVTSVFHVISRWTGASEILQCKNKTPGANEITQ